MRNYHVLSENHSNQMPSRIIFYDTETNLISDRNNPEITRHKFKMVTACFVQLSSNLEIKREQWLTTEKLEEFHTFLISKSFEKTRLYVMAHNQNYDMITAKIFPMMKQYGFSIKKMIMDSGKVIITFRRNTRTVIFIDSINWFKVPLKKLGESINLPKLQMPSEIDNDEKWNEYNKRDVLILKEYFLKYLSWVKSQNMGNFAFTIASQSFNAFRHNFMKHEIHIHNNEDAIKLERESFHGGRTDVFKMGVFNRPSYYLDINSMYPFVMKMNYFPIRLIGKLKTQSLNKLKEKLEKYCIIARVRINTKEPVFPKISDKKLIFPIGCYDTTLTTPELKYALENNMIKEIFYGYVYESGMIFTEFVDYMYDKRKTAKKNYDELGSQFYKLIQNSLYGKFGQQIAVFEDFTNDSKIKNGACTYFNFEDGSRKQIKYVNSQAFIETEKEESYNSFCAIASHVTAYSRMLLWSFIKKVKNHVFYCDTDSLFVDEKGFELLQDDIDEFELGKLKIENKMSFLKIRGLKDYVMEFKINNETIRKERLKGINLRTSTKITENSYQTIIFPKLRSMINKNNLDEYFTINSTKILQRKYSKGSVNESGVVYPIELNN